jgi:hypothetical protein
MDEVTLQWISILKILLIAVFAGLYGFGGISGKWKRRYIAPVVLVAGICGFGLWLGSFTYWYLLCAPLLFGALSLGYGADTVAEKIKKRTIYGLACAAATLPIFIVQQAYTLIPANILVVVCISVVAGVWNQTSSARAEETLIGAAIVLIPTFVV